MTLQRYNLFSILSSFLSTFFKVFFQLDLDVVASFVEAKIRRIFQSSKSFCKKRKKAFRLFQSTWQSTTFISYLDIAGKLITHHDTSDWLSGRRWGLPTFFKIKGYHILLYARNFLQPKTLLPLMKQRYNLFSVLSSFLSTFFKVFLACFECGCILCWNKDKQNFSIIQIFFILNKI